MMKKRENEMRLIEEQERKYQSMFKPNSTLQLPPADQPRSEMFSRAESQPTEYHSHREMSTKAIEKCETLFRQGTAKIIKKRAGLSEQEYLAIERTYDENLTFQPSINKLKSQVNESVMDVVSQSEARKKRIDELAKPISSSATRQRCSVERLSEQNSVLGCQSDIERKTSAKNDQLLGDKVDKELRRVLSDMINQQKFLEDSIETLRMNKDALRQVLEKLGYLNTLTCLNEEVHSHLV